MKKAKKRKAKRQTRGSPTWPPGAWKPKRRGAIYCSPACGANCTWAEHQWAKREAKVLAKHLGKGWEPRVWENMRWFWKVVSPCDRIKVHPTYDRRADSAIDMLASLVPVSYLAFLGTPDSAGGKWSASGDTPGAAIRNVVAKAIADLAEIQASIGGLEEWQE